MCLECKPEAAAVITPPALVSKHMLCLQNYKEKKERKKERNVLKDVNETTLKDTVNI